MAVQIWDELARAPLPLPLMSSSRPGPSPPPPTDASPILSSPPHLVDALISSTVRRGGTTMSSVAFVEGSRMSRQASLAPPPSPSSHAGFSSVDQGGRLGHHRQPNKLPSPIPNLHPSPRKSAFTTSTPLLAPISLHHSMATARSTRR